MDEPLKRPPSFSVAESIFASFRFAWAGICYAFQTQRNFRIQTTIGLMAVGLSFFVHLQVIRFLCICLTIVIVLSLELLNTAIEAVVDLTIGKQFNALAKTAKDCSAGAVLLSAIGSIVVAVILLLPPLLGKFGVQIPSAL